MGMYSKAVLFLLAVCLWAPRAAPAQQNPKASAAADDVTLFVSSCVNFSGNSAGLRGWLAAHGFKQVPAQDAIAVLNGHGAEVFMGQTKWGGPALVASLDNGDCVLNVDNPGKDIADAIFQSVAYSNGATFAAEPGHPTLDDHADRSMEEVVWQNRKWVITTAVADGPDDPSASQLDMLAVPVAPAAP
jgi:hypothetical protein